jgi:hypothetical protein
MHINKGDHCQQMQQQSSINEHQPEAENLEETLLADMALKVQNVQLDEQVWHSTADTRTRSK